LSATATVLIDRHRPLGRIDERIYGQFLEQLGRAIYGGVYEPGSPLADAEGHRVDVLEAARGLRPSVLRWPGGNFASGYHWHDGIGPAGDRPLRRDLAWNQLESNAFGTEEFLRLSRALGAAPYLNLNVSTGTIDEAISWVEYCNTNDDLPEARLRRAGPHPAAHDVAIWGIGNENYGWWQHGHTSVERYAEIAREWGKLLKWTDPQVRLVAVGSPEPDWNWTVLKEASRFVDFLSLHFYWNGAGDDPYHSTIAGPQAGEADIVAAFGMSLAAQRSLGLREPVRIAVDEWGVWSRSNGIFDEGLDVNTLMVQGLNSRSGIDVSFEEPYDLKDALAVASWLHVLWRHPEKVTLATQAQMVNVIAPIHTTTDAVVLHSVYWPLAAARAHAGAIALDVRVESAESIGVGGLKGLPGDELLAVDAAATLRDDGALHLSLVNRSMEKGITVELPGLSGRAARTVLTHDDPFAGNTVEQPRAIWPVTDEIELDGSITLPPHSHTTLVLHS
jgi:alpha-N-arabinofuranosidase